MRFTTFAVCLIAFSLGQPCLTAQESRGTILGRVTDPTGAVIVGASIRAVNTDTGLETKASSSASGDYLLPYLAPGPYRIIAESAGFKTFSRGPITLQVDDRITLDAVLEIGLASETITVTAEEPLLNITDASMGQVIDDRRVMELPLKDGNPIMLAGLSSGVANLSTGGFTRPFDNDSPSSIAVNGSRTQRNEFSIDGAPNTAGTSGNVAFVPPSSVVQQFKIQTATFDAAYGFAPGAAINVSLKSGSNALHGQLNSFLQNPVLNANSFFSNRAGLPKNDYRQNRWGGMGSGPVMLPRKWDGRNRTFWMYGYEGMRDSLPRNDVAWIETLPTAAQRSGDFSGLLALGARYQIYDPATIAPAAAGRTSRQPFAGNLIPRARIATLATAVVNRYFPQPNLPGTIDGTQNNVEPSYEKNQFWSQIFRIDHAFSDHNRFFVRGEANGRHLDVAQRYNLGTGRRVWRQNRGFGLDDVYTVSAHFLINARYSYTRYWQDVIPVTSGTDLAALGFAAGFVRQVETAYDRGLQLPRIDFISYPTLSADARSHTAPEIHSGAVNFTWLVRSHALRFGAEHRVYRETGYNLGSSSARLVFGSNWTRGPADNSTAAPLGQDMAGFLLGLPASGSVDVNASYAQQYQISAWYIQDAWRVSPALTINLGLRYEVDHPTTERFNRSVRDFSFEAASPIEAAARAVYANAPIAEVPASDFRVRGGVNFAGVNGQPRGLWSSGKHNFAPRLAAAYKFGNRIVLRAGWGMFFDIARTTVDQTGFSRSTTLVPTMDNGVTFLASLSNPFPEGFMQPNGSSLGLMTSVGQTIKFFSPDRRNPSAQRWQAGLQFRLAPRMSADITYVGNAGLRLPVTREYDAIPARYLSTLPVRDQIVVDRLTAAVSNPFYPLLPGTSLSGRTTTVSQLLRPYPQFTSITSIIDDGYSWYHSVQARLEKRFSRGYTLSAAWTWSKFMEGTSYLNPTDASPAYVISDQDRTHRVSASGIWELPFGKGRRWGSAARGVLGKVIGGWQGQGMYQAQSGAPLSFGNAILSGSIESVLLPSRERSPNRWFRTDRFETDSRLQLSNNIRGLAARFGAIRSPGLNLFDLSLTKNTYITEHTYVQFRSEFANAFNRTHFGVPNTTPSSTAFGTVTATTQFPRSIQFGLKLIF